MPRVRLSDTSDWEFVHSDQDLRDRELWDSHGHKLGTIDDMVIDTDLERVVAVTVSDGAEYPAEDLSIADDAVYVLNYDASLAASPLVRRQHEEASQNRRDAEQAENLRYRESESADDRRRRDTDSRDEGRLPRDEAAKRDRPSETTERRAYTDFSDDFRDHYDRKYGDLDRDFTDWEPAYRFGYDMAHDSDYVGRDFDDADEDLRRGYYRRMGYPMSDQHVWADVRDAVRHAYESSR
jgi:sporulation protein YlmC with PRC-barrel domain